MPKTNKSIMGGNLYIADSDTLISSDEDIVSGKIPEGYVYIDSVAKAE